MMGAGCREEKPRIIRGNVVFVGTELLLGPRQTSALKGRGGRRRNFYDLETGVLLALRLCLL